MSRVVSDVQQNLKNVKNPFFQVETDLKHLKTGFQNVKILSLNSLGWRKSKRKEICDWNTDTRALTHLQTYIKINKPGLHLHR